MATESLVQQINHITYPGRMSVRAKTGLLEAASQSYKAGAVVIASSGKVATAVNAQVTLILGIADKKATGTTNAEAIVLPAIGMEFEVTLENQSTGDYALLQADLFANYGLRVTSGGLWYLNKNDTSTVAATVVELVDPVGTVQGRVRAKFIENGTIAII